MLRTLEERAQHELYESPKESRTMHGHAVISHIDRLVAAFNAASPRQRARMLGLAR